MSQEDNSGDNIVNRGSSILTECAVTKTKPELASFLRSWLKPMAFWIKEPPSNLVLHAEEEMRRAGLYDNDADYGGMIPEAVMKLVRAHASEMHSGGSHSVVMKIFNRVINFKTLSPITNDPSEWMEVSDFWQGKESVHQSKRDYSCFSNDGGKTYYSVDEEGRPLKTAADKR